MLSADTQHSSDINESSIFTSQPVYVRKKFCYIGHATTTYSVEQAALIVDFIGRKTGCDTCLPFAVRLVEGGELISIAEDNGEFACGDILTNCLKKVDGYNVLVCVSQKVSGMFVTDMVQGQKHKAVKEAAAKALDLLHEHLTNGGDISAGSPSTESYHLDLQVPVIPPSGESKHQFEVSATTPGYTDNRPTNSLQALSMSNPGSTKNSARN